MDHERGPHYLVEKIIDLSNPSPTKPNFYIFERNSTLVKSFELINPATKSNFII